MEIIQMDLFGEMGIDISTNSNKPTPLVWSFSKRGMLEQCPRRYYDYYYGSNKNTAKNDPQKENLRFLKKYRIVTYGLRTYCIM